MYVLTPSALLEFHRCFGETETEWTTDRHCEICLEPFIAQKHQFCKFFHLMQIGNDIASKIKAQREKLPEIMEPDFGIRRKLISSGGLRHSENEQIEAEATRSGRSKMLLDFILANGNHQKFIDALRDSGQIHVVNWIMGRGVYRTEYGSDWPLDDREINVIDRNFDKLSSNLITAHGFVEKLHSNGIINCHEMELLKNEIKNSFKHSEDFLSILRRFSRRSFSLTLECLRQLNQDHVAKLPEEGEDYNSDNDFSLPLEHGYRKIEVIESNYEWLIDNLDIQHGLLDKMFSKKIINLEMMEFLTTNTKTSFQHNEDFLGILRRFSHNSFSLTVKCLRESNQNHIAELLEKGGSRVRPMSSDSQQPGWGSGSGKGGGAGGGAVRDAGGAFGKRQATKEEEYFRQLNKSLLETLKNSLADEIEYHEEAIERHKKKLEELKKLTQSKD